MAWFRRKSCTPGTRPFHCQEPATSLVPVAGFGRKGAFFCPYCVPTGLMHGPEGPVSNRAGKGRNFLGAAGVSGEMTSGPAPGNLPPIPNDHAIPPGKKNVCRGPRAPGVVPAVGPRRYAVRLAGPGLHHLQPSAASRPLRTRLPVHPAQNAPASPPGPAARTPAVPAQIKKGDRRPEEGRPEEAYRDFGGDAEGVSDQGEAGEERGRGRHFQFSIVHFQFSILCLSQRIRARRPGLLSAP